MPPRDEQDFELRRQQIIDGALEAFAEKGFNGASNKDIAEAAHIGSPGLIYHYFKDKVDLLHQVILERMPLIRLMDSATSLTHLPPEEALPQLIQNFMGAVDQWPTIPLAKVIIAESIRNPRVASMVNEVGPGRALNMLATYLEQQMDAGRLRRENPHVAARLLVGPAIGYMLSRYIFDQSEMRDVSSELMGEAIVETFLQGMRPE